MKVILILDVPKVGKKYDIKDVADGFARNVLFPKKAALIATKENVARIETEKKIIQGERSLREGLLTKNIEDLDGARISIEEPANELGHLFAGVHAHEIVKFIKESTGLDIDASLLILPEPIKETGEHVIAVKAHGKKGSFTLSIIPKK